jgi:hypothetical protein
MSEEEQIPEGAVEEFLDELFIHAEQEESQWSQIGSYFGLLLSNCDENFIVEWTNPQFPNAELYVQKRPNEDKLTLEAMGWHYLKQYFPKDTLNALLELGWTAPGVLDDCMNFSIVFEDYEIDYEIIGKFVMETFKRGYGCTLEGQWDVGPLSLSEKFPLNPN